MHVERTLLSFPSPLETTLTQTYNHWSHFSICYCCRLHNNVCFNNINGISGSHLPAGEYVAAEKIEAAYKKNSLVEQIWVYGNSLESTLVAIVVPAGVRNFCLGFALCVSVCLCVSLSLVSVTASVSVSAFKSWLLQFPSAAEHKSKHRN